MTTSHSDWYSKMRAEFEALGYMPQEPPPRDDPRDINEARRLRDEGMADAEEGSGSWFNDRLMEIFALPKGWEGTGEDIRYLLLAAGAPEPPNLTNAVWGALMSRAVRLGWFIPTGEIRPPRDPHSHASKKSVWRRV